MAWCWLPTPGGGKLLASTVSLPKALSPLGCGWTSAYRTHGVGGRENKGPCGPASRPAPQCGQSHLPPFWSRPGHACPVERALQQSRVPVGQPPRGLC